MPHPIHAAHTRSRRPAAVVGNLEDVLASVESARTVDQAARLLARVGPLVALTGAGMSTDSGIPDYRGPDSPPRAPMTYQEFRSSDAARQRYWARSHLGWLRMARAVPNAGHRALVGLQATGRLGRLITQNVDGLDSAAGSTNVIDLHGRIDQVVCLSCGLLSPRAELHSRLADRNPGFGAGLDVVHAPDGDAELADTGGFVLADCTRCAGLLKPNVVFFGENVPKDRVQACYRAVDQAEALLVAGSSLTVMSGLRFVKHASRMGMPIVIVNRGSTRGDELASVKIEGGCSTVLTELTEALV